MAQHRYLENFSAVADRPIRGYNGFMGMRDGDDSAIARSETVRLRILLQLGGGGAWFRRSINFGHITPSCANYVRRDGVNELPHRRARPSYARRPSGRGPLGVWHSLSIAAHVVKFRPGVGLLKIVRGSTLDAARSLRALELSSATYWSANDIPTPLVNFLFESGEVRNCHPRTYW